MAAPYNLTGIGNAETFGELVASVNTVTGDFLMIGLILTVYIIILVMLVLRDTPFEKAILATSYICMVPTLIFASVGFIGLTAAFWMVALMFLAALASWIIDRYF